MVALPEVHQGHPRKGHILVNETLQKAEWRLSDLHRREEALTLEMLEMRPMRIEAERGLNGGHVLVKSARDVWERKVRELAQLREDIVHARAQIEQVSKAGMQSDALKTFLEHVADSANNPNVSWRLDMQTHCLEARVTVLNGSVYEWQAAPTPLHAVDYHAGRDTPHFERTFTQIGIEDFHLTDDETYAIACGCDFDFDDTETPSTALQRWVMRQAMLQRVEIAESAQAHAAVPDSLRELVSKGQS